MSPVTHIRHIYGDLSREPSRCACLGSLAWLLAGCAGRHLVIRPCTSAGQCTSPGAKGRRAGHMSRSPLNRLRSWARRRSPGERLASVSSPGVVSGEAGGDLERWAHVLLVVDPFRRLDVVEEMLVHRSSPQGRQRAKQMPCLPRVAAGQRLFPGAKPVIG